MKFNYLWILYALLAGVGVYYIFQLVMTIRLQVALGGNVVAPDVFASYLFNICLAWAATEILRRLDE